jgi:glycosyltransferase involved in cell wall biosynthesis
MPAKISICIPTYLNPAGLRRLLGSLRSQSYRDFEAIITDDSPNQCIEEVCSEFAELPGLIYVRNTYQLGSPANWNKSLSMARGEWIMLIHHDDWFSSENSLRSFASVANNIYSGWIFSSCDAYEKGLVKGFTHRPFGLQQRFLSGDDLEDWTLMFENKIGCPSVMLVHHSIIQPYDENLLWFVDVDLYIRLLQKCPPYYIADTLVNATYGSEEQITHKASQDTSLALRELIYLYDKYKLMHRRECRQTLRKRTNNIAASLVREMIVQRMLPCSACTRTRVALDVAIHMGERSSSLRKETKKAKMHVNVVFLLMNQFMRRFVSKTRRSVERLLGFDRNQQPKAPHTIEEQPHDVRPYLHYPDPSEYAAKANNDMEKIFYRHTGRPSAKWHHYLEIYDRHLSRFRGKQVRLLEIGVQHGGSLQIWREYFGAQAIIYGIDIDKKCRDYDDETAHVRIGSQADPIFLQEIVKEMGGIDVVIDDGSHVAGHQKISFGCLFPLLNENGVYLCEDLQASYWPVFHDGGYQRDGTFIELTKQLMDDIHSWYHEHDPVVLSSAAETIHSISTYEGMVVLEKRSRSRSFFTLMPPQSNP